MCIIYILYLYGIADKYAAHIKPLLGGSVDADIDKLSIGAENGFLWDTVVAPAVNESPKEEDVLRKGNNSEVRITSSNPLDRRFDFSGSKT